MAGYYACGAFIDIRYLPHPYFHFWNVTLVNINGFSANLVCALILRRSGLELLMGKFCQFLTDLFAGNMTIFSCLDRTLVNINGFSPNLVCALILWRSGLELLMGKFCQFLTDLFASNMTYFHVWTEL